MPRLDEYAAAERAYNAFVTSAQEYLPPNVMTWSEIPEPIRKAWKAAVLASRDAAREGDAPQS